MLLILCIGFVLFSVFKESELHPTGAKCKDLTGTWKNELNSNFTIENITDSNFIGSYYTGVESSKGAFSNVSKVSGMIKPIQNGKLIAFSLFFNGGAAITTWVGQCIVCNGEEILFTTFVVSSYVQPRDNWMSLMIGNNTFHRRKEGAKNENEANISAEVQDSPKDPGLKGDWTSPAENSFTIRRIEEYGLFQGANRADGKVAHPLFGRFDGNETHIALSFVSATSPSKIIGLVGHIRNPQALKKNIETTWLEHTFNPSCSNPRKNVKFYENNYNQN